MRHTLAAIATWLLTMTLIVVTGQHIFLAIWEMVQAVPGLMALAIGLASIVVFGSLAGCIYHFRETAKEMALLAKLRKSDVSSLSQEKHE